MTGPEDIDLHAAIAMALESVPAGKQADTMRELVEATGGMWLAPAEEPAIPHYQELMVGGIHATGATMAEAVENYLALIAGRAA